MYWMGLVNVIFNDQNAITNGGGVAKWQFKDVGTGTFKVRVENVFDNPQLQFC